MLYKQEKEQAITFTKTLLFATVMLMKRLPEGVPLDLPPMPTLDYTRIDRGVTVDDLSGKTPLNLRLADHELAIVDPQRYLTEAQRIRFNPAIGFLIVNHEQFNPTKKVGYKALYPAIPVVLGRDHI